MMLGCKVEHAQSDRLRIDDLLAAYRADRAPVVVSVQRLDTSIMRLRRHLADHTVAGFDREVIAHYAWCRAEEGVRPATVRRELITLRAAWRVAWRDGRIAAPPPKTLPPAGLPRQRILSVDEISRLRRAAAPDQILALFGAILIGSGARAGAVRDLEWTRVDLLQRIIDFRASHPKAERQKHRAVVPIGSRLLAMLRRAPRSGERLFTLSATTMERRFRAAAEAAGLPGVTAHVLRHTAATHLLRRVPLVVASRMIGHRSVAITEQGYGHLVVEDLVPAAKALDDFLAHSEPNSCRLIAMSKSAREAEKAKGRQVAIETYIQTGDIVAAVRHSGLPRAVIYSILDEAGIRRRLRRPASPSRKSREAARRREVQAAAEATGLRAAAALSPDDWSQGWPEALLDKAVALAAAGLSGSEIAELLSDAAGRKVSRSAVLGKLYRHQER